ncbi:Fic family protein [candidate division KSB1 bacterium]|nr:Fic family protein [candidate division KSB1 bacterium]
MNLTHFQNSSSGQLLQFGIGEAAYWAFIPNSLPPPLQLDAELVRVLSDADRALGELAGLGRATPNPQLLVGPFIRREAVLSSRIEGTQASLADLYAYEAGQLSGLKAAPPESDVREVHNYVRAMEYGLERVKALPISLRLLRELHQWLMEGVRGERATPGEFRRSQNWIGRPGCTLNNATYVPPPVNKMHEALDAFEKYLHAGNEYPPLVRLAFIHYQFEAIHPFLDGNGRIGRLLISLLLMHWNLLPLPLLYLSAFFERHREDYYDLLLAVSERGAWREWALYFLRGVEEQAQSASSKARQLQDLQLKWREQLQRARVSGLAFGIADFLFQVPILSAREVQDRFKVSHPAAVQAMQRLEKMGILQEATGKPRNRIYIASAIMQIVE